MLGGGGRYDNDYITNFLPNSKVKKFLKSANIWQSYERIIHIVGIFTHSVVQNAKVRDVLWAQVLFLPMNNPPYEWIG